MLKKCAYSECSKIFVRQGRQIYCCTQCKSKAHYQNNREKYIERSCEWQATNKERRNEWQANNKEQIKERMKEYYKNNKEKRKEYSREYYQTHPIWTTRAVSIRGQSNRRARKLHAGGTYTEAEYIAKGEAYGWKCRYCGIQLSYATAIREHSIPLARGGDNCIDNIFPSCQACNNEKYTMTGIEYMVYRMRRKYLARSERNG